MTKQRAPRPKRRAPAPPTGQPSVPTRVADGPRERAPGSNRFLPLLVGGALVIGAAVIAVLASGGMAPGAPTGASPSRASTISTPAASGAASAVASGASAASGVTGASLPELDENAPDDAIGRPIPEVAGRTFGGDPISIRRDGTPKILVFLAHWCSHCQAEVPVIRQWLASAASPPSVEILAVATAIDPRLPNYPPDAWLERERWTVPTLVDPDNRVAQAYGLSAFPYFVVVDGAGTVIKRLTGELKPAELDELVALATS